MIDRTDNTAWSHFRRQQYMADKRNIPWLFSFEEWCDWWDATKVWHKRGRGKGKACMSRYGDQGPYSWTNCYVSEFGHNVGDARRREIANGKPSNLPKNQTSWNKGKTLSEEHCKNLSESHMGHKRSPESIAKQIATRIERGLPVKQET